LNFTLFIDKEADVLMSHGAADKNYMWRKAADGGYVNHQRRRSHLFVPGAFLVDRISKSKLSSCGLVAEPVGCLRLDGLLAELAELPCNDGRRCFLYAPTHDFHLTDDWVVMSSHLGLHAFL